MTSKLSPLRLGVVGAGPWGQKIIKTIRQIPEVTMAWLASSRADANTLVPPDCKVTGDWRELLDPDSVDGLVLAVPPQVQGEVGESALRAGLPILFEKPLALSSGQADLLTSLALDKALPTLVDHIYLFHAAYRALKNHAAVLGKIVSIEARGGAWGPFRKEWAPIWDWAPHDIAMCLDLVGEDPVEVAARRIDRRTLTKGFGEIVRFDLTFPLDVSAWLEVGNLFEEKHRYFAVRLEGGELIFDDTSEHKLRLLDAGGEHVLDISGQLPLTSVVLAFAERIRTRSRIGGDMQLASRVVRVIEASCQQISAKSGRI